MSDPVRFVVDGVPRFTVRLRSDADRVSSRGLSYFVRLRSESLDELSICQLLLDAAPDEAPVSSIDGADNDSGRVGGIV